MKTHQEYMQQVLRLAKKGTGFVSPNPLVGCILVKEGKVLSQGYHQKYGEAHAEVNALRGLKKEELLGATLYVNLEPCAHHGKTPPCVEAVLASGIKKVVIAMSDPNPLTSGKSIQKLKAAGVEVIVGVEEAAAKYLNRFFIKTVTQKSPYVLAKIAQSQDGKISAHKGQQSWLTGKEAKDHVQNLRSQVDAVLVGIGTVLIDDPQLTVRDESLPQPKRVIIDPHLKMSLDKKMFKTGEGAIVLVTCVDKTEPKVKELQNHGVSFLFVERLADGQIDLKQMLGQLYQLGVTSLLVEGGAKTFTSFYQAACVDEWQVIEAPLIIGEQGVSAFTEEVPLGDLPFQKKALGKDTLSIHMNENVLI